MLTFKAEAIIAVTVLAATPSAPRTSLAPPQNPPSKIAFVTDRDGRDAPDEIYVMNADGTDERRLTVTTTGNNLFPEWSPDGTKLAFSRDRDGVPQIYVMNADGSGLTQLTTSGRGAHPSWSPNGDRIAFTGPGIAGASDILLMNADGTGVVNLTRRPGNDQHPAWSPDGTKIAFNSNRDGNADIYVMNADGTGEPARLTVAPGNDMAPAWSPDGRRITFESSRDGNREIYVMDADGTDQLRLTFDPRMDAFPSWAPDGRKIVFQRQVVTIPGLTPPNGSELFVMNVDGTEQAQLTHRTPASFSAFASWGPRVLPTDAQRVRDVTIVGTDYAFGIPPSVEAGLTAFSFDNRGTVRHELSLVRLKPGVTLDSVLHVDSAQVNRATRRALVDASSGGILVAEAGERTLDRLLVDLVRGRTYLLICNFRDAPGKPTHAALGMVATFEVR